MFVRTYRLLCFFKQTHFLFTSELSQIFLVYVAKLMTHICRDIEIMVGFFVPGHFSEHVLLTIFYHAKIHLLIDETRMD